ncbi:MAG: hypothetical protein KDM64_17050 [Verrucomicrobiae bacterium]|nr:hypothetical protein [Verrucomicrobiae bacterium]
MKTTLELPDSLLKDATASAAAKGCSLSDYLTEAVQDKLDREREKVAATSPEWMNFFGAFANTPESREETSRIQSVIEAEFGQTDPLE